MTDNGRLDAQLNFHLADALMLMQALNAGYTRTYFTRNPGAGERFQQYARQVEALVPEAARHFSGETLCEINMALEDGGSFAVNLVPPGWRQSLYDGGSIRVTVFSITGEEQSWDSSKSDHKRGTPAVEAVHALLSDLAPINCVGSWDNDDGEGPRSHISLQQPTR